MKVIATVAKKGLTNPMFLLSSGLTLATNVGPPLYEHFMGEDTTFEERLLRLEELQDVKRDMHEVIEAGYGDEFFDPVELTWYNRMLFPDERGARAPKETKEEISFAGSLYFEDVDEFLKALEED